MTPVYRHCCVIDATGNLIDFVRVLTMTDNQGQPCETVEDYTLQPGESLLDVPPPTKRLHAGTPGLVRHRWNGTEWVETATPEEIAAWELEHPAPTTPSAPTLDQRTAALEAAMLAMMGGGLDV